MKGKKHFGAMLACLVFLINANAQPEKIDYQVISKIKNEAFYHSKVMETLFNMTDVIGPRLSGSTQIKSAQLQTQKQLSDWGLANSKIESWGGFGKGWEVQKSYVAMTVPYYQALIAMPKAWTPGTNGLVSGFVTSVKIENELDFDKYRGKLRDKIVLISANLEAKLGLKPEARRYTEQELKDIYRDKNLDDAPDARPVVDPIQMARTRAARLKLNAFLIEENVLAVISARGGLMGTLNTTNGASFATHAKPVLPELEMGTEHFNRLIRLLEVGRAVKLEIEIKTAFQEQDTLEYNVIAEIPGTDKNLKSELVMLGAHLDSWHAGTGATDDAAGCAVMMEVMRILKSIDIKPRRTIRIALWSAEEQGLLGSRGYVKKHFADYDTMILLPEHAKLSAYYNLDNGGGKIRGIYLQGNDALRQVFEAWLEPFRDMDATTVSNRSTGSTDHVPFDNVGLPAFQFIQDPLDYGIKTHHTNMDTYDRIQKADLMQASAIIASIVYHTAMRDEKLARKQLPKAKGK